MSQSLSERKLVSVRRTNSWVRLALAGSVYKSTKYVESDEELELQYNVNKKRSYCRVPKIVSVDARNAVQGHSSFY